MHRYNNSHAGGQYFPADPYYSARSAQAHPAQPNQGAQYGAPDPYPAIPAYADSAPRPLYRRHAAPQNYGESGRRRLSARLSARAGEERPPNPFTPMTHLAPDEHYLQPPPALLYNPFYVRRAAPEHVRRDYEGEELNQLRAAGFRRPDRAQLMAATDPQFRFVMGNASWLAEHGFAPADTMEAARLAPSEREFVARQVCSLNWNGFRPRDVIDLAQMAHDKRLFVLAHGAQLRAIGCSPQQMMLLATRPGAQRRYVVEHGMALCQRGYSAGAILRQARNPAPRPAPDPALPVGAPFHPGAAGLRPDQPGRRASASALPARHAARTSRMPGGAARLAQEHAPRRSTTTSGASLSAAERLVFEGMGLERTALDRLARISDTARTYVLVHGADLLAAGVSFDDILGMAQDTSTSAGDEAARRPQDGGREPAGGARGQDLSPFLSRLGIADDGPSAAAPAVPPPRTASPEPMEAPRIAYPRNNAPLAQLERDALDHAHRRWSRGATRRDAAEEFYRNVVPESLAAKLAPPHVQSDDPAAAGHPNLRLLLAGVAYAEDNRTDGARHMARVKALTAYITSLDDAQLLSECDTKAAEGVTHCGDRVAYGLTRVEQVVLLHQIQRGELPPRRLVEGIESVFLQPHVENIAAHLANARKALDGAPSAHGHTRDSFAALVEHAASTTFVRTENSSGGFGAYALNMLRGAWGGEAQRPSVTVTDNSANESLEMYAALVPALRRRGVNLVESAQSSTYGGMYQIDPLELDYACAHIDRHVRDLSSDFLREFEGNTAMEKVLKQCFQDDFRAMCAEREDLQEQTDDALFDANALPGTQETVDEVMTALASIEKEWYRDKLKVVLAQRHLLDRLPPLAPDLAYD